jgi:MFS family permease
MIFYGAGMGCCISSFTVAAQETAPAHQRGIATALTQFSRSIGGTIGIAMLGALMGIRLAESGVHDLSSKLGDPALVAPMHSALSEVFLAMALTGVLAALLCFLFFPEPEGALTRQEESA